MLSQLLEFLLDLWAVAWKVDERVNAPSRQRWPVYVALAGGAVLIVVWILELARVL